MSVKYDEVRLFVILTKHVSLWFSRLSFYSFYSSKSPFYHQINMFKLHSVW